MFPRHVWWYRLLVLHVVVLALIGEAIAKTEDNLTYSGGPGISITCPAVTINFGLTCSTPGAPGAPPSIPSEFLDTSPTGDIAAFAGVGGTVVTAPACGPVVITAVDTDNSPLGTGCDGSPLTLARTYTIYEDADNSGTVDVTEIVETCVVQYIIEDDIAPTWDQAPGALNVTLGCTDSPVPPTAPTASDNCSNVVVNLINDLVLNSVCQTIYRYTYQASDECGNLSNSYNVDIILADDTPPVINILPQSIEASCFDNSDIADYSTWLFDGGFGQAEDIDCGFFVSWNSTILSQTDLCGAGFMAEVEFTATDNCGNGTTAIATYTLVDDVAPSLSPITDLDLFCPDFFISYEEQIDEWLFFNEFTFIDECSEYTLTNDYDGSFDPCLDEPEEVIYTATDACGNISTQTVFINPDFTTDLMLFCPIIDCSLDLIPAGPITFEELEALGGFADGCGIIDLIVSYDDAIVCDEFVTITITATDECGNEESCSEFLYLDPVLEFFCPPDGEPLFCLNEYESSGTLTSEEFNFSGGFISSCSDVTISYTDDPPNADLCAEGTLVTRSLTAENSCGNVEFCSYIFVIESFDFFVECPDFLELPCGADLPVKATTIAEFMAQGGNVEGSCSALSISCEDSPIADPCDPFIEVIRTYTITNDCGQEEICEQFIFIDSEATPLTVTCPPSPATLACGEMLPAKATTIAEFVAQGGTVSSSCSTLMISCSDSPTEPDYCGPGSEGTITRTYTITNDCGSVSSCVQNITYETDVEAPVLDCDMIDGIVIDYDDGGYTTGVNNWIAMNVMTLTGSGSSDCTTVSVTTDYTGSIPFTGSGTMEPISFIVTDQCGNMSTCVETVTLIGVATCTLDITCPATPALIGCGQAIPAAATTVAEFTAQGGTITTSNPITSILSSDSPTVPNYCGPGPGVITRTYLITNDCGLERLCVQTINYETDTEAPVVDCNLIDGIVIDYDDGGYTTGVNDWIASNIGILAGIGSSDCTGVTVTTDYIGMVPFTGSGTMTNVNYFVTDACGNTSTCTETITLIGEACGIGIVCQGSVCINLSETSATFEAESAILEINPTCDGAPFTYGAARMVAGSCAAPGTTLSPTLEFCCADAGTTQMVMVQVTDSGGSMATCMVEVEVKDITPPSFTSCPSSQPLECHNGFDINNLSIYGVATATDQCGEVSITETVTNGLNDCGVGTVTRTFTATDESGLSATCSQELTINNSTPFDDSMIVWPPDVTVTNNCDIEIPGPEAIGFPSYPTGVCTSILQEYEDTPSTISGGCAVVQRTWKILDWCQFDSSAPQETYLWEYIQLITFVNTSAPIFDACEPLVEECGNELTCMGMLSLSITAQDDCTADNDLSYSWELTLENGNQFVGTGNSVNGPYPYGEHTLIWIVDDGCGNTSSCVQIVHIRDCKPPQAVCLSGVNINITEMPGMDPMVEIWATDFDASSSDNCTPTDQLEFAFDANFTQPALTFNCSHAGTSQNIMMYVRDADGNVSFCKTTVGIQDNHGFCAGFVGEGDGEFLINGRVAREDNTSMTDVDVMIKNDEMEMHYMTDEQGSYAFENIAMNEDYVLEPDFEGDILNGLTTLDIIAIQRHILGIENLSSPYKIIAADINNSEHISGADIVELRKVILGVQNQFNSNTNWRFLQSAWTFADQSDPFPISEVMNIYNLDHDANGMDFIGIKTGDVNNSAVINNLIPETISNRSAQSLVLKKTIERGFVRLTVMKSVNLTGFQFALNSNLPVELEEIYSSVLDLTKDNHHVDQNLLKFSWSASEHLSLEEGDVLLEFSTSSDQTFAIQQSNASFKPEAYDEDLKPMEIRLDENIDLASEGWEVYRNTPNPFIDKTEIPFYAPHNTNIRLSVFTVDGTLIFEESKEVSTGYQTWTLNGHDFGNVHGVLYYRLESGEFSSTQPFIKLR